MANSVDPDQTAPIGTVCSGFMLFASKLKFVSNVRQLFAADDFSRRHFQMHVFLALQGLTPFKNIFHFITAGDWDCVAAVERLPALHYSVDFIFLSFGIMGFIVEL